jgi:RNA polymerase sigma-70 factor (ECF subfamily)
VAAFAIDRMSIDGTTDAARDDLGIPGERALIEAAAAGDREAFDALVLLHERVAVRTALAALGRHDEAEDVTQEAFLRAWQRLPGFRREAAFRTWLMTIVWRLAMARRRARQQWWQRFVPARDHQGVDRWAVQATGEPGPEALAVGRAQARAVAVAIAALSPKLRDALLLAASGEHSYDEIGALLGIATGTVKWRVSEARRRVADAIGSGHEN